jgi:hypothetical protein
MNKTKSNFAKEKTKENFNEIMNNNIKIQKDNFKITSFQNKSPNLTKSHLINMKNNQSSKIRNERMIRSLSNTPGLIIDSNEKIIPVKKLNLDNTKEVITKRNFIKDNKTIITTNNKDNPSNKNNITKTSLKSPR